MISEYRYYLINSIKNLNIPSFVYKTRILAGGQEVYVNRRQNTQSKDWNKTYHKPFKINKSWKSIPITKKTANSICRGWWKQEKEQKNES